MGPKNSYPIAWNCLGDPTLETAVFFGVTLVQFFFPRNVLGPPGIFGPGILDALCPSGPLGILQLPGTFSSFSLRNPPVPFVYLDPKGSLTPNGPRNIGCLGLTRHWGSSDPGPCRISPYICQFIIILAAMKTTGVAFLTMIVLIFTTNYCISNIIVIIILIITKPIIRTSIIIFS